MKSPLFSVIFALAVSYTVAVPTKAGTSIRPNGFAPNKITLVHTNDIHAHLDQFNVGGVDCSQAEIDANTCYGGIARIKTAVDQIRKNTKDVLMLDAGDQFQGTMFFNIFGGKPSAEFMNDLKYDAMSLGNHEFDRGVGYLADFIKSLNFPALSSNIELTTAPRLKDAGVVPYIYLEKYSLAIIGYITKTTAEITTGGRDVKFYDPVAPVQKYVDELHSQGIKRIICVSHNGYHQDQYLAQNTKGVQLIVGGHSHSLLLKDTSLPNVEGLYPTVVKNLEGKDTYVVQAHRFGDYLGYLELEWDLFDNMKPPKGDPILLDQQFTPNPEYQAKVDKLRESFSSLSEKILGKSLGDFLVEDCITGECAFGNLVTDCMIENHKEEGAQIAMVNSGAIRASILKGPVSHADIMIIAPFGSVVASFKYSGKQIMKLLENSAAMYNPILKKSIITVPQYSGLTFDFDSKKPIGSKITKVLVGGKPLEMDTLYNFYTLDYIADGGDNMIPPIAYKSDELIADSLAMCIERRGTITPAVEGRFPKIRDSNALFEP
ncbi:hypothetical protein BDV3_003318 [Batrachochytrium dendrobatidis]